MCKCKICRSLLGAGVRSSSYTVTPVLCTRRRQQQPGELVLPCCWVVVTGAVASRIHPNTFNCQTSDFFPLYRVLVIEKISFLI